MTFMSTIRPPEPPRGPSPRLDTLHRIELVLRRAQAHDEGPLSLAEIKRRLPVKSIRHATVRACINELARLHLVTEDPARGVLWTLHEDPAFWARGKTRRLA